jgi:hypothetical protein
MAFGNPSTSSVSQAAVAAKQGNVTVAREADNYIFASGILSPEHSDFLSYQFPQYLATAILERIGRYEAVGQDVFSWSEMARTRKGATASAVSATGSATITVTTDIAVVSGSDGYYIVGDQVLTETGVLARVSAVGASGGFQTITLTKADGTNWGVGNITAAEKIGHIANSFGEYSDAPKGRLYLPNERYNVIQTLRRSIYISGKALTNKTYFKDKSWAYEQEMIELDEFSKDRENAIVFGQLSAVGTDAQTCEGIITTAAGGVTTTYTGAVTEQDIKDHITALKISSGATEYVVFCGAEFLSDAHTALQPYALSGGITYGSFGSANMVGISLAGYKFMDTTVMFVHYPTFDDGQTLPHTSTATATKKNYSNFSAWFNMGGERGKKYISLKYKELDKMQRKFILKTEDGMMGDGAKVANGKDGKTTHLLSDISVEMRGKNKHGLLYAIG